MWALIYSIVVLGTHNAEVYSIKTYPTYVECFKQQQLNLPNLSRHESLNCVMIKK